MPKRSAGAPRTGVLRLGRTVLLALCLAGASGFLTPAVVRAQEAREPDTRIAPAADPVTDNRILAVNVSGVETVDTLLVLNTFNVKPGDIYRIQNTRDGIKALYRLGLFDQVKVNGERTAQGVILTVDVTESPRISAVEFHGNKDVGEKDLREKLTGVVGKVATGKTLKETTDTLVDLYREEGFPRAVVNARFNPGTRRNDRILTIDIEEKSKVRITSIVFTGNEHFKDSDLRGQMDTHQKSFWHKGYLKQDKLDADLDKIRTFYQRKGFRDVRVLNHEVDYAADGRTARVVIHLTEGPLYRMGPASIEGNKLLPTAALERLLKFKEGEHYNRQKIDESAGEIGGVYADRGYLYAQVDPVERIDSATVFITYRIEEQEPSKVREIRIAGNTRTKEKVIRRQLYMFPGSTFDRALLIRSQRELFQLGFFQDVQVDFRPLPNSYDVDLVLDVKEKPVGTASAGAGFSSQSKLTGFLELGHPNLFGNGQAVNIRVEKGSRTTNFELSFTEPWFLDTPTTLGMDLYHTRFISDLYETRRTGGAVRASRPIPGVPYARAFGNYTFENTDGLSRITVDESLRTGTTVETINSEGDTVRTTLLSRTISTPDPILFDRSGRNTSSLTLGVSRNSTDHPTYPRTGMSSVITTEIAGGFLQGDISFQKYILDNRLYFQALNAPKFTKPAFMFRVQMGGIGFNGRQDPLRVPLAPSDTTETGDPKDPEDRAFTTESLELFRLGGTQRQALRGYRDYEVVPAENVRARTIIDTLITRTETIGERGISTTVFDTTTSSRFVYDTFPGGRYYSIVTMERQFTIAEPLHGVFFAEAGGTWNRLQDVSLGDLHKSIGFGIRMEIPLLGQVGFDYAYGFNRLNREDDPASGGGKYNKRGWQPHLLFGRFF